MYLAEEFLRVHGLREGKAGDKSFVNVIFTSAGPSMFAIQYYSLALDALRKKRGIEADFKNELIEVRGDKHEAVYKTPTGEVVRKFSMLHVTPPMTAPDFIASSPLVDAGGFIDVDKYSGQHTKYKNVFSLGDCSNLPTSKTAAAITAQAPVIVANIIHVMKGQSPTAAYSGYTSCPIITGKNELMLAEFTTPAYDDQIKETFPGDSRVPRYAFAQLYKYVFPFAYWNFMLKGNWYGASGPFEPNVEKKQ